MTIVTTAFAILAMGASRDPKLEKTTLIVTESELKPESEPEPEIHTLAEALDYWKVELDDKFHAPIEKYCKELWDWNTRINLTRHDTFAKFVARDLVDTQALAELIPQGKRVLDVGSGGGIPGLVLSILRPDLDITVCDSVTKKAKALGEMAGKLKLPVTVANARAEKLLEITSFDVLTARAVGSLAKILRWFDESWDSIGLLLLIKGPKWVDERGEARHVGLLKDMQLRKETEYDVPGVDWKSVILSVEPES